MENNAEETAVNEATADAAPGENAPQAVDESEALKAEIADLKDKLLRAMAEAENIRRRAERDTKDASQYAVASFAREMLGVADNFTRAISACGDLPEDLDPKIKGVFDGVTATERQLLSTLERFGVKAIDTADGKFDPHRHQAIAEVPGSGKPKGSIVNVVQTGFMIGDRLLRPAMVTVAADNPAPAAEAPTA